MTRRLPPSWTDWGVPAVIAGLAAVEVVAFRPDGAVAGQVLIMASCLALVPRRRWPIASAVVAGLLATATPWFGAELNELASPILILVVIAYTLARWVPGYRGLLGLAVVLLLLTGDYVFTDERDNNITDVFFVLSLMAPPYVLGKVARKLAEQGELLRDQQELVKREAVRDERDRIARELHDVIAHSVSAMVVQTAAAQDLVRTDPERAEQVLDDVAATGRRALAETGQLLHVIRDTADELGLEPTPGLAQVPDLVERFRADGLEVRATIDGPLSGLPAAVDTSAYRLVQEALTNALRYAPDHTVDLQLAVVDGRVTINTSNRADGPHHESASQGSGLGLLGLAERVSLLGGTLTHGRTPGGRFELSAVLPAGPA